MLTAYDWPVTIGFIVIAYLIGSIPMSLIVGKITKGVDIRDYGSGNPGTTNAVRVLGRKLGLLVFLLDVLKGGVTILLARFWIDVSFEVFHPLFYGFITVLGHIFSLFLRFKGGRGVATSVGIFLFYAPLIGVIGLLGFLIGLRLTHYVSVGSLSGASAVLLICIATYIVGFDDSGLSGVLLGMHDLWLPIIALIGVSLIFYRHRTNIKRLKNGTEPKANIFRK